ncbi:hypothetical protein QF044_001168 [Chryseobacterium sp. W4I1]|nr:hypothetical protein [Chryseobacterium sp. W4I1]
MNDGKIYKRRRPILKNLPIIPGHPKFNIDSMKIVHKLNFFLFFHYCQHLFFHRSLVLFMIAWFTTELPFNDGSIFSMDYLV